MFDGTPTKFLATSFDQYKRVASLSQHVEGLHRQARRQEVARLARMTRPVGPLTDEALMVANDMGTLQSSSAVVSGFPRDSAGRELAESQRSFLVGVVLRKADECLLRHANGIGALADKLLNVGSIDPNATVSSVDATSMSSVSARDFMVASPESAFASIADRPVPPIGANLVDVLYASMREQLETFTGGKPVDIGIHLFIERMPSVARLPTDQLGMRRLN